MSNAGPGPNITLTADGDVVIWDSKTQSLRTFNLGNIAWVLASVALVWLMVPAIGLIYAGQVRRKNSLSMMYLAMVSTAVCSVQWFLWGYSLAFTDTGSMFIGDLSTPNALNNTALTPAEYIGLHNAVEQPFQTVPVLVFSSYQLMFCTVTAMLAIGAVAERGKLAPVPVFLFCWVTLVYCFIAYWNWNPNGWANKLGTLDWAGGSPVHITSGTTGLAISAYLNKRKHYKDRNVRDTPASSLMTALGTALLWFGWFGFNGGSALAANLSAAEACIVTHIAASVGGLTWLLYEHNKYKQWSLNGFCSGAIAGLVAITPGAGYVGIPASLAFGVFAGVLCNIATGIKVVFGIDDHLDIFALHAIGGLIGNILTGIFADRAVAAYDGVRVIPGGWVNQNFVQLGWQLAASVATMAWSFGWTSAILWAMHKIPGLRMQAPVTAEIDGIDKTYCREYAYDYVALNPEPGYDLSTTLPEGEDMRLAGVPEDILHIRNMRPNGVYGPTPA